MRKVALLSAFAVAPVLVSALMFFSLSRTDGSVVPIRPDTSVTAVETGTKNGSTNGVKGGSSLVFPGQSGAIPALVVDLGEFPTLAPGYGRADLRFDELAAAGASCTPKPIPAASADDQAPPLDSVERDFSGVFALSGMDLEIYNCMLQCLPTDQARWEGFALAASRACFDGSVLSIVKVAGLERTWDVMSVLLRSQPTFSYFCHTTGHGAGSFAVKELGVEPHAALRMVNGDCLSGALHGVLDSFAESSPSLDGYARMVEVCVEIDNTQCADGIGHGLWNAFGSYKVAAEVCGLFKDQSFRFTCDGGVFMVQVSEGEFGAALQRMGDLVATHSDWQGRMVGICSAWAAENPRTIPGELPGEGCWSKIGYGIWMPLVNFVRVEGSWRDVPHLKDRLNEILGTCAGFGPDGESVCHRFFGEGVAPLTGYDASDTREVCALVPSIEDHCLKSGLALIEHAAKVR